MKAVTWRSNCEVSVEDVPDPRIDKPTDAIIRVTSTNTHIKVPDGPPDDRFVYLSEVLPTAWQSVAYADVPDGGAVTVLGLGRIGDMATRIAQPQGKRVLAVDLVPEQLGRDPAARGPGQRQGVGRRDPAVAR